MLLVNALKTVCDLLLCFTFAALIESYSEAWLLTGTVLLLGFLSSLILQKTNGSAAAKVLCGLMPALSFLAVQSFAEAVITAVILAFFFVLTLAGANRIHYEEYKYWFAFPAVPVIIVFFVCLGKWPIRPMAAVCAGLYLFLGILVLRRKRMGAGAGLKLRAANMAELAGIVVFAVLASLLLYLILSHSGRVLEVLLLPFGFLFNAMISLTKWLINLFMPLFMKMVPPPEETVSPTQDGGIVSETLPTDPREELIYSGAEALIRVMAVILALAFLAYILYRLYKMIRSSRMEGSGDAAAVEEGREEAPRSRRHGIKRKKFGKTSNNEKIRTIYKDYLFYVRSRGVRIDRQTTSEDVLDAADRMTASGEAERLRELYIRARYHNSEEMSDEEVEEAKKLLAFIRERTER